ncbi:peptidyl-prolyl cis-trans isomerase [Streptomyces cinereoruber]|uniref:Peptidyl-prolyl cis-trans isomerase n=1 Tax=Streptomyces cinereoruber TaxID=67260 RepID=A0AAV4KQ32_9ACTN|nr:peptidyl-prolyl cis-trans isomerase [Streptomyces cinereoruber]
MAGSGPFRIPPSCEGAGSVHPVENEETATSGPTKPEVALPDGDAPTELTTRDLVVGDGAEAKPGGVVRIHYVGVTFATGKEFDSSWERDEPFKFAVGGGRAVKGLDRGIRGMRVGGRREIVVPPRLGYGKQSPSSLIPAHSTLVFVVDLLSATT